MSGIDLHRANFKTLNAIKTPKIMRVVAVLLLASVVAAIGFLTYTPWVQTTSGAGSVTALDPEDRQQTVNAFVSGRIEEWFVREGSMVRRGEPIAKIVDNDPQLLDRLEAERAQVVAQLEAVQRGLATARIDLDRMEALFNDGLAARRDFEQAQIRVEEFRSREAQAAAELSRVDVNLSRQSVQIVEAPRDGVVLNINAGDKATFINTGDVLATFVPEAPERVVEVFVTGRDVALVQPGAKARIQFEGWPAVQFSGWPSVAVGTFGGVVTAIDPSAQPNGQFRVLIAEDLGDPNPWPEERYVRFGASARAWILLETVPLGYELWRQLNSFPPTLPASNETAA